MSNIVLSKFAQRQERLANFGWAIQPPSHLAGDVVRMATFEDENDDRIIESTISLEKNPDGKVYLIFFVHSQDQKTGVLHEEHRSSAMDSKLAEVLKEGGELFKKYDVQIPSRSILQYVITGFK